MADPFDALREPIEPVSPRPSFSYRLWQQVVEGLGLEPADAAAARPIHIPERRTHMSTTDDLRTAPAEVRTSVTPYITVHDGTGALEWYARALGAVEQFRVVGDDGLLGHSEFTIGEARIMMSDEYPEMGVESPRTLGGTPLALHLTVPDVDALHERAVAEGATSLRPPADQSHGNRTSTILDPYGHRWMLSQPLEEFDLAKYAGREGGGFTVVAGPGATGAPERVPVELGYASLAVGDAGRAQAFFGELFGWQVDLGEHGGHVANTRFPLGLDASGSGRAPTLYFRVEDLDAVAARVEELGGSVLERSHPASGRSARCVDDQGTQFDLWEPAPGY